MSIAKKAALIEYVKHDEGCIASVRLFQFASGKTLDEARKETLRKLDLLGYGPFTEQATKSL